MTISRKPVSEGMIYGHQNLLSILEVSNKVITVEIRLKMADLNFKRGALPGRVSVSRRHLKWA